MAFCLLFLVIPPLFILALLMAVVKKTRGWIIAAVASGVLGLLFVVGVVVTIVFFGFSEAKKRALPRDFTTNDGSAMVTGGPGWKTLDIGSDDADLGIGNIFSEQYLVVIGEAKADFPAEYDLASFAELAFGQFLGTLSDVSAGEPVEVTKQSLPRLRREIDATSEGIRVHYLIDYVEGRNDFYQVMSWTLEDRQAAGRPILEAALDSFRETPSASE